MSQLDDAIRHALSPEDVRALDALSREEPLILQALHAFQGQNRLYGVIGWLGGFGLFGLFLWCAWRAIAAPDLRLLLLWGGGALLAMIGVVMIKLWFFMEMQKNSIVREVKRLELQVAALIARPG
ncbi:MAG: hypothetical protein KF842_07805 [Caulobacter sp.]|nr:hypothetical protein [Caulobacter sp.]